MHLLIPEAVVSALAVDALSLRQQLQEGMAMLNGLASVRAPRE